MDIEIFYDNNKLNKNKLRESWIKKHYYDDYLKIIKFNIEKNIKFSQQLYNYIHDITEIEKCDFCKEKNKRFDGFQKGYNKCCSKSCASKYSYKQGEQKRKLNTLEKYGVEHTSQLESVKKKMKKTNLEKYGVEYIGKSEKIKFKIKQTMNEKYGVDRPLQNEKIMEKLKNSNLEKYGVDNPLKLKEIQKKINKTNLERYGNKWSIASEKIKNLIRVNQKNNRLYELKSQYKDLNIVSINDNFEINIKCNKCNKNYIINSNLLNLRVNRYKIEPCIYCNPLNNKRSSYEKDLEKILLENNINVITNSKSIIPPYEIDVYLPDYKIGIEINGLYWHSEFHKTKSYHLDKTILCNKNKIRLIHIWEDEWLYKKEIVLSKLFNLLHKNSNKIYARKTEIRKVDNNKVKSFFIKNHLQGYIPAKYNYVLYYNDKIVSAMSFGKTRKLLGSKDENNIELLRFCNKLDTSVIGSASKLFKYALIDIKGDIITYAKRDWTLRDNNLYEILNFKFEKYTKIGYYWAKDTNKYHRYNFRKDKLISQGFDKSKSESQIMNERGYYKIYDTGNLKYIYNNFN